MFFFEDKKFNKNLPESYEDVENGLSDFHIEDLVIFEANKNNNLNWHMMPHQDVNFWWGGSRNVFNCNIYLNDDYEGGEITFYKYNGKKDLYVDSYSGKEGEAWIMEDVFTYKPKAGDALLLHTDAWHAVLPMQNNTSKYYIRQLLVSNNYSEKNEYVKNFNSDFEFKEFYNQEQEKANKNRITPYPFNSLNEIDLDRYNFYDKRIPFIIGNYKNNIL